MRKKLSEERATLKNSAVQLQASSTVNTRLGKLTDLAGRYS